ncbi:MAG TPA: hypothetical protein VGU66_13295 [Candidatus Elarobacter sp.]|nr:hypothetical protein [Candidatus Elarobacter sp.]
MISGACERRRGGGRQALRRSAVVRAWVDECAVFAYGDRFEDAPIADFEDRVGGRRGERSRRVRCCDERVHGEGRGEGGEYPSGLRYHFAVSPFGGSGGVIHSLSVAAKDL